VPTEHLAAASRPFGILGKVNKPQKKPCGRKPNEPDPNAPATVTKRRVWWKTPLLFGPIQQAVNAVGFPWPPTQVVRYLQKKHPGTYDNFHKQRIHAWRDHRFSDQFVWKKSVLRDVARGYQQKPSSMRSGILVRLLSLFSCYD
jgi:hypothetical protein